MLLRLVLSVLCCVSLYSLEIQAEPTAGEAVNTPAGTTKDVKAVVGQPSPLIHAVAAESVVQVKVFLEQGVAINGRDEGGNTALMVAAQKGKNDIAQLLVDRGADVNLQNKDGMTALMFASQLGHEATVMVLVGANASINTMNNEGATARLLAKEKGHDSVDMILKEAGGRCL
ncbi:MAG: ankyrin repeat protein [Magnetococcales bacterium]|nr:ankyrin repeat protein [Magnetococcales bacterium]HIJ84306.1 ankyrin repeat domain-containing protein [Magnetococcales bacterium]